MQKNELTRPIDRKIEQPSPPRRPLIAPLLISLALVIAIVAAFWVAVVDDPNGGRPAAVATIEEAVPIETGSVPTAPPEQIAAVPPQALPEMVPAVPPEATPQGPSDEIQLAALPQLPPEIGGDPSLLEYSNYGPIPRVSPDGRRPREIYSRRSPPVAPGVPRIVIVVGGLGLSQTGTQAAIETLPEDVTLAFAPYGGSLQRWVGKARDKGHEVLLQVPLEPMDYPAENPGEHTLLVSGGAGNRQDLHWALGRITAYAGVMNHMGARFVTDERALVPFLGEIGERGLFYLDDGSSEQSVAAKVGEALQVPVLTANRILDRARSPDAVARELDALEAEARAKGIAIGVASAFPASVEAISAWIASATTRGILIVPASAALGS
jgi:polysaccharide deacetylase 2 family uncharacterized protein YibQ